MDIDWVSENVAQVLGLSGEFGRPSFVPSEVSELKQ